MLKRRQPREVVLVETASGVRNCLRELERGKRLPASRRLAHTPWRPACLPPPARFALESAARLIGCGPCGIEHGVAVEVAAKNHKSEAVKPRRSLTQQRLRAEDALVKLPQAVVNLAMLGAGGGAGERCWC